MPLRPPARTRADRKATQGDQAMFEPLERRELLTIDVANPLPDLTTGAMGPNYTVSLLGRYTDSFTAGMQVVRLSTSAGNIDIALRSDWAPNTVANFLQYVTEHFYDNTIFQLSQRPTAQYNYALIQGGGFRPPTTDYNGTVNATNQPQPIPTSARHDPVALEHPTGNTAYTVALVHDATTTSGTSEFFIHTIDNSSQFDAQGEFAGYATFGQVLPFTRPTVNTINNYTYYDAHTVFDSALTNLPLVRPAPLTLPVTPSDYITINSATLLPDLTDVETTGWAATITSGSSIASVSIVDGNLVLTPTAAHNRGTVTVNVHVTSIDGTTAIDDDFTYEITNYAPLLGGFQGQSNVAVGQSMLVNAYGVSDPDAATGGGLVGVEFWYDANDDGVLNEVDDVMVGSDTSATGGWSTRIDTSAMVAGANRVFARVTDTDGEMVTTSRVLTLRAAVPSSGVTPDVVGAAPGQNVNLGFNNALPDGASIQRISLFIDTNNDGILDPLTDRLIGHATFDSDTSSWGFTVNNHDLSLGANRVFARVTDDYGNLGGVTSTVITVGT